MLLAGCGGGGSSAAPLHAVIATPTAPPAGPLGSAPAALAFDAAAETATVKIAETGYTGSVAASGCGGVAGVTPSSAVAPATFSVKAQSAGSCTLAFTDAYGQTASVAVGVTLTGGTLR
jgi:hypothetical protein